jgi:peptide/nickel transport system permease protein
MASDATIATPATATATSPPRTAPRWLAGLAPLASSAPAIAGILLILFWTAAALLAPWIAPYPPNASDLMALAHPTPSARHLLGTDHLGRDMLSRLLWGARTVLAVAPVAVLGATTLGSLVGLVAGYYRGWIDVVVTRISDIVLSFPVIILYMIILATYGSSALNIILVITVTKAPIIARIVRGITLELRGREYVAAAKMRGERPLAIMLTEILPNARGPLIVDVCLRMGYTIITIGVLGFLGLGLPPPDPDWGGMVNETRAMAAFAPWMTVFPCIAISSLVLGLNLLADGLREISLKD